MANAKFGVVKTAQQVAREEAKARREAPLTFNVGKLLREALKVKRAS